MKRDRHRQIELAAEAIEAIFRIHSAARKTNLDEILPHLGPNDDWISNFANAADALLPCSEGMDARLDRVAACEAVASHGRQFVTWDCRSGDAAIGRDGWLRWFDFEYSGLRHGADDIAWLIGDQARPLSPGIMELIPEDCFDPDCGHVFHDYLEYRPFHCLSSSS